MTINFSDMAWKPDLSCNRCNPYLDSQAIGMIVEKYTLPYKEQKHNGLLTFCSSNSNMINVFV